MVLRPNAHKHHLDGFKLLRFPSPTLEDSGSEGLGLAQESAFLIYKKFGGHCSKSFLSNDLWGRIYFKVGKVEHYLV